MGYKRVIDWNGVEEVRVGWMAVAALAAVASAGTAVYSATKSPNKPKVGPIPKETDPAIREAAEAEAAALRKKRGYASTMLTGGEGLTTAPTTLKTELGA